MKKASLLILALVLIVPAARSQGLDEINVVEMSWAFKIYQGIRPGAAPPSEAAAKSYSKPEFLEGLGREADLAKERDLIRTTFNLREVRPISQAEIWLRQNEPAGVVTVTAAGGRPLSFLLERLDASWLHYRVTAYEGSGENKAVMRSAFTIPSSMTLKDAVVFGFEDSGKNPFFLSLRITNLYAEGAGATAGAQAAKAEAGAAKPVIIAPRLSQRVAPVYPEAAKKAGVEGTVVLSVTLDEKGHVIKARIIKSIPELDQAALDALRQWTYEPMTVDGKPRPVVLSVNVEFKR
jgi:TonB family protein